MQSHLSSDMLLSQSSIFPNNDPLPQRCLISLIQVTKLKNTFQQFKQSVLKQFQVLKNGISLVNIGYQSVMNQMANKCKMVQDDNFKNKENLEQKTHRIEELLNKISMLEKDKAVQQSIYKKQIDQVKKQKMQSDVQIQKLNVRINELYGIINTKTDVEFKIKQELEVSRQLISKMSSRNTTLGDENVQKKEESRKISVKKSRVKSTKGLKTDSSVRKISYHDLIENRQNKNSSRNSIQRSESRTSLRVPLKQVNFSTSNITSETKSSLIFVNGNNFHYNVPSGRLDHITKNIDSPMSSQNKQQSTKSSNLLGLFQSTIKSLQKPQKLFK